MVTGGSVESEDGQQVPVRVRSVCVHGDTPGAVASRGRSAQALEEAGVRLAPFA